MRRRYFALKILRPIELSGGSETMGQVSDKETSQTRMLKRLAVLDSGTLPRGSPVENDKTSHVLRFVGLCRLNDARGSIALVSPWMRHGNLMNTCDRTLLQTGPDLVLLLITPQVYLV